MTPDYHERTRLQGASNFIAQFAWVIAPWFFKIMDNKSMFTDIVHGARTLAIIIGAFILFGGILPAIFNKEHFDKLPKPKAVKGFGNVMKDFFRGFVITLKCRPFVKLCAVTFLNFNSRSDYFLCQFIGHFIIYLCALSPKGVPYGSGPNCP